MRIWIFLLFCVFGLLGVAGVTVSESKQVVGWAEKVRIFPGNLVLRAKMDTGADYCSLHVPEYTLFERNGEPWIRFHVTGHAGERVTFERRVIRIAKIKRHTGARQERPVVRLTVCVGNIAQETEVNLIDRSRFKFPLLIGRNCMADRISVDPSLQYTVEPDCPEVTER